MKMFVAGFVVATASAALAQPDVPSQQAVQARGDSDRVVCEFRSEPGSRLSRRRICMTEAQWATYRREARNWLDRVQPPPGAK